MPENNVTGPITDQEIAFACLVLSGTMTDRRAAQAVGLDPDSAAYTQSKPRIRAYMLEHRVAGQQQPVEQDIEEPHRLNPDRSQILTRLWEIANLAPERTRGSITGQVKALSMIVAIEGLIPDRRALSAPNKPAPTLVTPPFYTAAWLRTQPEENDDPQPPAQEEAASEPPSAPGSTDGPPPVSGPPLEPTPGLSQPALAGPLNPSPTPSLVPRVPMADYVAPDTRIPFSININKNPFGRRR